MRPCATTLSEPLRARQHQHAAHGLPAWGLQYLDRLPRAQVPGARGAIVRTCVRLYVRVRVCVCVRVHVCLRVCLPRAQVPGARSATIRPSVRLCVHVCVLAHAHTHRGGHSRGRAGHHHTLLPVPQHLPMHTACALTSSCLNPAEAGEARQKPTHRPPHRTAHRPPQTNPQDEQTLS